MRIRTFGAIVLAAIYAACFTLIKIGLAFAPPLFFGGMRALIAGVALLGLVVIDRRPLLPVRGNWPCLLAIAMVGTALSFGAMFLSPGRTDAGIASVLGNMQALIAFVLSAVFLGEQMTYGKGAALALGMAGVALIAYPSLAGSDTVEISGAVLALMVSVSSSVGSVIFKRTGVQHNLMAFTAWQLIIGSLPLFALSALLERGEKVTWSLEFIGLLLFLALVGTSFVFAAWFWLVQRDHVSRLTIYFLLTPVFGLAIAALVLKEKISLLEIIGSASIILGIGVTSFGSSRGAELYR